MRRLFLAGPDLLPAAVQAPTGPKMAEAIGSRRLAYRCAHCGSASVGEAGDAILFPRWAVDGVYAAPRTVTFARFGRSVDREGIDGA